MKILAYIGAFNESVDRSLAALRAQTRPPDGIVVVDNASTESPPEGPFPPGVTFVRSEENLGPSGAISRGMQLALETGYEWIWVFDADSEPEPDALAKLVELYESLDAQTQDQVGALCCSHLLLPSQQIFLGRMLTPGGPRRPRLVPGRPWHECDAILWSGSLYRLDVVRTIGLPRCGTAGYWDDFGHDYGDMEFSLRVRSAGQRIFVHREAVLAHHIGDSRELRVLGRSALTTNHPAERRFLFFRNMVYFWVYLFPRRNWPLLLAWFGWRFGATISKIVLTEPDKAARVTACVQGIWCGLRGELDTRHGVRREPLERDHDGAPEPEHRVRRVADEVVAHQVSAERGEARDHRE